MSTLSNKRVAILATDGYEQSELESPMVALKSQGVKVDIVSPSTKEITGWSNGNWAKTQSVDIQLENANAKDYDALVLPGGVINPDKLRRDDKAVSFVRNFFEQHKPVAAICHAPWLLVEADVVDGRKMTSFHSISKDLKNAGADWVNEAVVVDNGLITSRSPEDLEAFNSKLIEEVKEGKHEEQTA